MQAKEASECAELVKQSFQDWLLEVVHTFKEDVQSHLAQLIEKEKKPDLQDDLFKAQQTVLIQHPSAEEALKEELERLFNSEADQRKQVSFDELALVDDFEVERFVRRSRLVTQLLNDHKADIKLVEARLNQLKELGAEINPRALSPARLFEALQTSLDVYELPESARMVFVQYFEDQCVPVLINGYELVNKILVEQGIDSTLELKNIKSKQRFNRVPEESKHYLQQEMVGALHQLNDNISKIPPHYLPAGELSQKVQEILAQNVDSQGSQKDGPSSKTIESDHVRQIEFIEKIVKNIAEDDNIDSRVKELILEMQVPLAILSINDPKLFSDANHPGRKLVRELTLFGQSHKSNIDRRIEEVRSLVRQVCSDGGQVTDIVAETAESVWRISEQELEHFVKTSRMERRQRLREIRLQEAKQRVVLELREQLLNHKLPEELKPIMLKLVGPWMVVRYIRYGHNSRPWLEAVAYMMLAFDAIQPVEEKKLVSRRVVLRNHLLRALKSRTERSTLPEEEIEKLTRLTEDYFTSLNESDYQRFASGEESQQEDSLPEKEDAKPIETQDIMDVPAMHEKT